MTYSYYFYFFSGLANFCLLIDLSSFWVEPKGAHAYRRESERELGLY
jgi:hypothetical protein